MKAKNLFDFNNYRDYLRMRLSPTGTGRGLRKKLAEQTQTQPSFISNVITGLLNLSPEHIPPTNAFFGHSPEEAHFFTLLVLVERAGTRELEHYYQAQIDEIRKKRAVFSERIHVKETLTSDEQAVYYSRWHYAAIHVLTSIPEFQTPESIAKRLGLQIAVVQEVLSWLVSKGLIEERGTRFQMSEKRIHVRKDSPWIHQHHAHCRTRVMHQLGAGDSDDLHFSQMISVSKKDFREYRQRLLDLITEFEPVIAGSKEEDLVIMCLDLQRF